MVLGKDQSQAFAGIVIVFLFIVAVYFLVNKSDGSISNAGVSVPVVEPKVTDSSFEIKSLVSNSSVPLKTGAGTKVTSDPQTSPGNKY